MRLSRTILLMMVLAAAGCGDSRRPASLVAPTPTPPLATPNAQQSLSGYVADTAFRTIAGVTIEVLDGPQAGMTLVTDARGLFSYFGTFAAGVSLKASKEGYIALTKTTQTSAPGGRPWVYFQMELVAPPVNIAGDYTLTIIADAACPGIPSDLRERNYTATIVPASNSSARPGSSLVLRAGGASFLESYDTASVGVAGDSMGIGMYHGEDPALVERLGPQTYLAFGGYGSAIVPASAASTIDVPFDGAVEYCVQEAAMGATYACGAVSATHQPCQSKNHRLILRRR